MSGTGTHEADVLVVGAGHNGLVAACYLARAGLDVLVLEANDWIGGCTTSAALLPEAPEHRMSPCADDIIALRDTTIGRDLELTRFGYSEVEIDPPYLALAPDGSSLALHRDARRTAADGNVYHVDVTPSRMGPLRPARGFAGYRMPVPGLYLSGGGTHPGPSVSGLPGQQAARTLLRDRRRST